MSLDNIKVVVRARPQLGNSAESTPWVIESNNIFQKDDDNPATGIYSFDKIFDVTEKNVDIYNTAVSPMVRSALDGINLTVFAYGATCSGKTYTMNGTSKDPGVIPRIINEIFEQIQTYNDRNFLLRVSYVEIYSEIINDLLDKNNKDLKVREDVFNCVNYNPTEKVINSSKECLAIMKIGTANRTTGETQMNTFSSRSHSIFRIVIESTSNVDPDKPATVSHVNLIDLAGSERVSQTGATGQRFKEGAHINKSLTALGLVIRQLVEKKDFINYRDSKLTRILSNSLGGNAKTIIICNINLKSVEDTQSTLMFAQRAKCIKNKPKINEISNDASLAKKLANEFSQVKKLLDAELEKTRRLESEKETSSEKINRLLLQIQSLEENFVKKVKKPPKRRHTFCSKLSAISEDKEVAVIHTDFNQTDEKSTRLTEETMPSFSDFDSEDEFVDIQETHKTNSSEHTPVKNLKERLSAITGSYESLLEFTRLEQTTEDTAREELEWKINELSKECADLRAYKQYTGATISKLLEEKEEVYKLCKNDHEFTVESLKKKFHHREQELLNRIANLERSHPANSFTDSIPTSDEERPIIRAADNNSAGKNMEEKEGDEAIQSENIDSRFLLNANNEEPELLSLQRRIRELESELNDVKNDLFETQDKLVDLTEDMDKEEKKTKKLEEELKKEVELRIEIESKFAENLVMKKSDILQSLHTLENILGTKDDIKFECSPMNKRNILEIDIERDSSFDNTAVDNKNSKIPSSPEKKEMSMKINDSSTGLSLESNKIESYLNAEELANRKNSDNSEQQKDVQEYDKESIISKDPENMNDLQRDLLNSDYESAIEKLKFEYEDLLQLQTNTNSENEILKNENESLAERLLTLQNEIQLKIVELENQADNLKQAEGIIKTINSDKNSLEMKYKTLLETENNRTNELKDRIVELEAQNLELHEEKARILDIVHKTNCDIEYLKEQNSCLQKTYKSENVEREDEIKHTISQLKESIKLEYTAMMEAEEDKTREVIRKLTDLMVELRAEIAELQKEKALIIGCLNKANCDITFLNQQNSSLQEKYESEKLQRDQECMEKIAQVKESLELEYETKMQTEKNITKEVVSDLNHRVIELARNISKLEEENTLLKKESVANSEKYEQQLISLKTERDQNNERLSNAIKKLEQENRSLSDENAKCTMIQNEKMRLQQENEGLSKKILLVNNKMEVYFVEMRKVLDDLNEKNQIIRKITQEREILEEKYTSIMKREKANKEEVVQKTNQVVEHETQNTRFEKEKGGNVYDDWINPIRDEIERLRDLLDTGNPKDYMQLIWKHSQKLSPIMRKNEMKFLVDRVHELVIERNSLKHQITEGNIRQDKFSQIPPKIKLDCVRCCQIEHMRETGICDKICKKEIEKWKQLVRDLEQQQLTNKTKLENMSFENANLAEKLQRMEMKNQQFQYIGNKENRPKSSKTVERDGRVSPGIQSCNSPDSECSGQNKRGNKWKELRSKDHDSRRSIDLNTLCSETTAESCAHCAEMETDIQRQHFEIMTFKNRLESLESTYDALKKLCRIRNEEISTLRKQLAFRKY